MSSNVVQMINDADPQAAKQQAPLAGRRQPAPFLHDPAQILNAPPQYFLRTEGLALLLEHLRGAIRGRGAMQVIMAEHGRGKSALLRQLIADGGSAWQLCHIQADYHLGVEQIICGLGQAFFPDETVDFESLVHGLVSYGHREPYLAVIVDDAQHLSSYAIETLANIKRAVAEQGGDIAIVLCATPEMRKTVMSYGMSSFRERWIETHTLPRFNEDETTAYLKACYEESGGDGFTPSQLQIIHRRSCGVPAFINYHAELTLGRAVSDERLRFEHQQIEARQKKMPYFIGGGVAAIVLVAIVISLVVGNDKDQSMTQPPVASLPQFETDAAESGVASAEITKPVSANESKVKSAPPAVAKAPPKPRPVVTKQVEAAKPQPKAAVKPVAIKPVQPKPVVPKQAAPKPVVTAVPPKPSLPRVAAATTGASGSANNVEKVVSPSEPAVSAAPAISENAVAGVKWLLAQPPGNFTIQLAGSPSEKDINRYIRRSSLEGELEYVYLNRKNRSGWYVVLHGSFKSKQAALDIVDFFPPELQKNRPWIRQVSTLQRSLGVQ